MSNIIYLIKATYFCETYRYEDDAVRCYSKLEREGAENLTIWKIDLDTIKPMEISDELNRKIPKITDFFCNNDNPYLNLNTVKKTKTGITVSFSIREKEKLSAVDILTYKVLLDKTLKEYKDLFPDTKLSVRVDKQKYIIIK